MILIAITNFIISVISKSGYAGIVLLMGLESAAIPLPSELIMPFSGYLVGLGRFSLLGIALAGAIGSVIGSLVLYYIGYYGGRPLIERYGKYILVSHHDLDRADRFFQKYGDASNFIGRILPVVRTYISFPAGVARADIKKFLLYSFVGSFVWSLFLGWIGIRLGSQYDKLKPLFEKFDIAIVAAVLLLVAVFVWRHLRHRRRD